MSLLNHSVTYASVLRVKHVGSLQLDEDMEISIEQLSPFATVL
jgi:hypothetical protein